MAPHSFRNSHNLGQLVLEVDEDGLRPPRSVNEKVPLPSFDKAMEGETDSRTVVPVDIP